MRHAVGVVAVVRRRGEFAGGEQIAEPVILGVVAHRDDDPAVRTGEHLVGHQIGVSVAEPARRRPGGEVVHALVRGHRDRGVEKRQVDLLAPPGAVALGEGGLHRDHPVEPGEEIGDRDARLHRLPVGLSGHRHEPGHALDDVVVARPRRVGAGVPEPGDRAPHEPRVHLRQHVPADPEPIEAAGLEVLDQRICAADDAFQRLTALVGLEVERDGLLAPVGRVVIGRRPVALALDERRTPVARVVAPGAFDLDDLGPEVSERLPCPGPRENPGKLDDAQPLQRSLHQLPISASIRAEKSS